MSFDKKGLMGLPNAHTMTLKILCCSVCVSSAEICVLAKTPKPVLMPYTVLSLSYNLPHIIPAIQNPDHGNFRDTAPDPAIGDGDGDGWRQFI